MVHLSGGRGGEEVGTVRVLVMLMDQQVHRFLGDGHPPHRGFCFGAGEDYLSVRVADVLLAD